MGRFLRTLTDEQGILNRIVTLEKHAEKKRLAFVGITKCCPYCEKSRSLDAFKIKHTDRLSLICRSCNMMCDVRHIVEKLAIVTDNGCLLWPEQGRDPDFYCKIRRNLFESTDNTGEYMHTRCDKRCLNESHIFRYNSGNPPLWYRIGLDRDIDFNNLSEKENLAIRTYLKSKVLIDDNLCWKIGGEKRSSTFMIDESVFVSKKLFFEVFNYKIENYRAVIAHKCSIDNCVNPDHLELFKPYPDIPFWAKHKFKKPDYGFEYCQNVECLKFGSLLSHKFLCDFNYKNGKLYKVVCLECFSNPDASFKRVVIKNHRTYGEIGKLDRKFVKNIIKKYTTCCYCGRDSKEIPSFPGMPNRVTLHVDHIIPVNGLNERGTNDNSNLEYSCYQCNGSKSARKIQSWIDKLNLWLSTEKIQSKVEHYKLILIELSKPGAVVDGKFIARHMRNKINE